MKAGRSTSRRRLLILLAVVNAVVLYLNFKVLTIDDIKSYSEELSANLKKLRLLEHTYMEQWSAAANETDVEEDFVWEKVENLHLALPAYEKMRHTLSRLQDFQFTFSKRVNALGVSQEMLTYKSLLWQGDVDVLENLFVDVLQTNRSIKIGVLAGAISGRTICPDRACLYIDHVRTWLEKLLQTTVTLHNAALPFASSDYFAWCTEPHLDVNDMDILIWELATEDYTMRANLDKQRYDNAAQPQELLTRQLKALPSRPFLMYVNFMSPESIRNRDCVNSEYYAGRHLCRHYNVTSVSWGTAVCTSLWQFGFTPDELIHSGDLLSARAHEQGALFVMNFMKRVLKSVAVKHMTLTRTSESYINKLISLHDVFTANSNDPKTEKQPETHHVTSHKYFNTSTDTRETNTGGVDAIEKREANNEIMTGVNTLRRLQQISNVIQDSSTIHKGPSFHSKHILEKRSRFPFKLIHNPVCWPLSSPQFIPNHSMKLSRNDGWEESLSDRENWYTSTGTHQIIEVVLDLEPPGVNQTCVITLAILACDYCGQALAWLDMDFGHAVLVGGKVQRRTFRVVEIMNDVAPGRHVLSLKSLEDKPFKIAAIMTGHKDKNKY